MANEVVRLYRSGMKMYQIAETLGISLDRVKNQMQGEPRRSISTPYMMQKLSIQVGVMREIPPAAMSIILDNIKPNETLIACMARMIQE